MDANLPRWLHASLNKHFSTVASGISLRYFVEGVDEEEALDFQQDSALFRLDGPTVYEGSSGVEWYKVELQILLTDIVHTTTDGAYDIMSWAGTFQASMINDSLAIYRYGNGMDDDDSLIGCLEPDRSVRNNVRVANYGMIDKDSRVKQASVNGKFVLCPN